MTKYVDTKMVVSVAVGMAVFGAIIYAAKMTGNPTAQKVASVAKGA